MRINVLITNSIDNKRDWLYDIDGRFNDLVGNLSLMGEIKLKTKVDLVGV